MDAAQIKAIRDIRGWSQQKLADELGVDQATVSRLERGADPSGPVLRLLDRLQNEAQTQESAA